VNFFCYYYYFSFLAMGLALVLVRELAPNNKSAKRFIAKFDARGHPPNGQESAVVEVRETPKQEETFVAKVLDETVEDDDEEVLEAARSRELEAKDARRFDEIVAKEFGRGGTRKKKSGLMARSKKVTAGDATSSSTEQGRLIEQAYATCFI
jgi:hypothetical protein